MVLGRGGKSIDHSSIQMDYRLMLDLQFMYVATEVDYVLT